MSQVAVLFARSDSVYKTLPFCDVYDYSRDARTYPGSLPVVAHPPCRGWGNYSHLSNHSEEEKQLAIYALDLVRKWGGVLEHPATSKLWQDQKLLSPGVIDSFGGFTLPVDQFWFGHHARKRTFLYICGLAPRDIPVLPLMFGSPINTIENMSRRQRESTPVEFARYLLSIARLVKPGLRLAV